MTELITTKIVPPRRRPDLLRRARLLDRLLENLHRKLVVVSAPAGYGKTALLVDFADQLRHPVCWYTVTPSDTNLRAFASYIVGAVRQQIPGFGQRTVQRIERETEDRDAIVGSLVNELHAIGKPIWLIIDDYQVIDGANPVVEFLGALVPLLPDNCHLVIATRSVPDLGPEMVARLVAQREVVGIGQADLRFTPEEVRDFLFEAYDRRIGLDEAQELTRAAEGWITAIVLMSQAGDPMLGIARARSAGGRLYDYLAAEVLHQLSSATRTFLMESSVLAEMDPEIVDALLETDNAADILETLERQNILVLRLENQVDSTQRDRTPQVWYRYHSMFREFLQARLREADPQRYWDLQQRAGRVLRDAGYMELAVDHFLKAGAYEEAAGVIEQQTRREFTSAWADRLSQWVDALPREILERHPRLVARRARWYSERDGNPPRALELCEAAESVLRDRGNGAELAWVLVEKAAALRILGDLEGVIRYCEEVLELAANSEAALIAEAERNRGLAEADLGQLDAGVAALRVALDLQQELGDRAACAVLHNDLGHILHRLGNLSASDLHFRKALSLWDEVDDPIRSIVVLNNLAVVYHDRGRYGEALREYQQALERAREASSRRYGAYVLIGMGDVYRDLGRYRDAVGVYKEGLLDARKTSDAFLGTYGLSALGVTYHLMGETSEGIALVRRAYEDARERKAAYEMALYQLELGAIAHELGFLDEATSRLKHSIEYFQQGHEAELAKAYVHLAQTHHLAYRPQDMRECIRSAEVCLFRLAYDGFILPTLLRAAGAIRAGQETSPYLSDLLSQAEERLGPSPATAKRSPVPPLRVHMLGQPRVYLGDVPLDSDDWSRQRVQELLFYILTNPRRTTRQIGVALWPDRSPSKVSNNLYVTVSRLRQALDHADWVVSEDGRYSVRAPSLWVDVRQFREAIDLARTSPDIASEAQQLERAVSLYKGDFLADFPVGADDSWILEERMDLQRIYRRALERLRDYWAAQGNELRAQRYRELWADAAVDAEVLS